MNSNFERLQQATRTRREVLVSSPLILRAVAGDIDRNTYHDFLVQAYHHVRHTVPLLMTVGARLGPRHGWLQSKMVHYVEEELGHDAWILNDIAALGGSAERTRLSSPNWQTDALVAYAYDTACRRNPVAFFGMVYVLEGTSAALALSAADALQRSLDLPDEAFSYLRSHGQLDQEHVGHLESIVNRLDADRDLPDVITCARAIFGLYRGMFESLDPGATA